MAEIETQTKLVILQNDDAVQRSRQLRVMPCPDDLAVGREHQELLPFFAVVRAMARPVADDNRAVLQNPLETSRLPFGRRSP